MDKKSWGIRKSQVHKESLLVLSEKVCYTEEKSHFNLAEHPFYLYFVASLGVDFDRG